MAEDLDPHDVDIFAGRGDRTQVERLHRVLLGPPTRPKPETLEEAIDAYRLAHPDASRMDVFRAVRAGAGGGGGH